MTFAALQALVCTGVYTLKPNTLYENRDEIPPNSDTHQMYIASLNRGIIKLLLTVDKCITVSLFICKWTILLVKAHVRIRMLNSPTCEYGAEEIDFCGSSCWWSWQTSIFLSDWHTLGYTCEWSSLLSLLGPFLESKSFSSPFVFLCKENAVKYEFSLLAWHLVYSIAKAF